MKFEIKSDHGSIEIDSNVPILTDNVKINHIQVVKVPWIPARRRL